MAIKPFMNSFYDTIAQCFDLVYFPLSNVMSSPIDWTALSGYSCPEETSVTLEATVPTGFETAAKTEAMERFGFEKEMVVTHQGRILFDLPMDKVPEVSKKEL